jgi:hypothetical protein
MHIEFLLEERSAEARVAVGKPLLQSRLGSRSYSRGWVAVPTVAARKPFLQSRLGSRSYSRG